MQEVARFQASKGPNRHGERRRNEKRSKGQIEKWSADRNFLTVMASSARGGGGKNGKTAVVRNKLLNTSAPSREIGANIPPYFKVDARQGEQCETCRPWPHQDS